MLGSMRATSSTSDAERLGDIRSGRGWIAERIQIAQHGLFVRTQSLQEPRIVQRGVLCGRGHFAEHRQMTVNYLPSWLGHRLPFRQKAVAHILALLRRHMFERRL